MPEERERLAPKDATRVTIQEARMVLPGIQALFGFQLMAVFNERFAQLSAGLQDLHLASMCFVILAVALVMAPAAFHRIAERGWATQHFVELSSRFLSTAMGMLTIGLSMDMGLITRMILTTDASAIVAASMVLLVLGVTWFVLPARHRNRHEPPLPSRSADAEFTGK